jgi:hypothetical protein
VVKVVVFYQRVLVQLRVHQLLQPAILLKLEDILVALNNIYITLCRLDGAVRQVVLAQMMGRHTLVVVLIKAAPAVVAALLF